jgi:hypothetical protein
MRAFGFIFIGFLACALPAQLQGAGAPVALAASSACGPDHNHCVKPGTWFAVENLLPGSGHPAKPVYEKDGKYIAYEDSEEISWGYRVLRTEVAVPAKVKHKEVLVVWRPHDGEPPYPTSEEQAQSQSRWLVMIVDKVDPAAGTFTRLEGPEEPLPLSNARTVVELREIKQPKLR